MSSSTSPPASSGTLNLASSPTTSHNSIESININSTEQHLPLQTKNPHQPTQKSPPTNPSSTTDPSAQQPDVQPLPSLSAPSPPPTPATASPTKPPLETRPTELAAREAKAHVRSVLREDWEWPPTCAQPECSAIEWRERITSDNETLPCSPANTDDEFRATDNDSTTTTTRATSRKRKRRASLLLQEELSWNEGLRLWHQRRDCWAGARHRGSVGPSSPTLPTPSSPAPPHSSLIIPVAPPLLPQTNQIRASISESTYPAIYSKVVVQGLSPTVPINLADMVRACVMGWKKDGEWPPKPAQMEDADGAAAAHRGRGRRLARRGVGRVKRVLGLGHGGEGVGGEGEG